MRKSTLVPYLTSRLVPSNYFEEIDKEFEQLFNDMKDLHETRKGLNPHYRESDEAYLFSFDMPGVKADDIHIENEAGMLTIDAERKTQDKGGEKTYCRYYQRFTLPENVNAEKLEAHYENGVLNLAMPKSKMEKLAAKKVAVSSGEKPKSWFNFLGFGKEEAKDDKATEKQ